MKKKIIIVLIWLVLTGLYCLNAIEIGKSMGRTTKGAIEKYAEVYDPDIKGSDKIASSISYGHSYNLSKEFELYFSVLSVTTVIYFVATIACYHMGFIKKE